MRGSTVLKMALMAPCAHQRTNGIDTEVLPPELGGDGELLPQSPVLVFHVCSVHGRMVAHLRGEGRGGEGREGKRYQTYKPMYSRRIWGPLVIFYSKECETHTCTHTDRHPTHMIQNGTKFSSSSSFCLMFYLSVNFSREY